MEKELPKAYDPKAVENKWYSLWEAGGYFHAPDKPAGKAYCIVIPPPNITGALHMGHALNNTLQDILIRWKRMQGFGALWLPGTDHAGIATQNVVEREILKAERKRRHEIGREELIKRIWEWRKRYGGRILDQLKAMGASCDWARTRFTLDDGLSRAVRECFVRLYDEGLIYRGKYIVNWCPRCLTALADDEVEHREEKGHLWYIRYPIARRPEAGGLKPEARSLKPDFIVVATTRPETLLGDTAVAVGPKDARYAGLIGKMVMLPETSREIPIIADDFVDASFGTGAVKVTPAHDPNDFQIALRHNLPRINVMDGDATMSEGAGKKYAGLQAAECRKRIIAALETAGLLEKVEDHAHAVGHCYRCATTIEPRLSDQWFVKMRPLAEAAIRATEEGKVRFHPQRWEAFYLQWLENARDWCISRQIWWGHRIPVWYCNSVGRGTLDVGRKETCPPIVAREAPATCPHCGGTELTQDEDVLDTWFSADLWPFSALGWPDETASLASYYPTDTLSTARDIIYLWVARMVMMGLKFMGDVPFRDVYIHGTILDEKGRRMSKSLGNGIDPLDIIAKYGADAMRFSLVVLSTEGQDLKLSESKFEMGRNFCNKLWNAARFAMDGDEAAAAEEEALGLPDRWILNRLQVAANSVLDALEGFRFNAAAQELYRFVWNDLCDWYIEASKPSLAEGAAENARRATRATLKHVLSESLRLLHPFLPFITEEIWSHLNPGEAHLIVSRYPVRAEAPHADDASRFAQGVIEPVEAIRNIRGENGVPPGKRIPLAFSDRYSDPASARLVEHLARVDRYVAFDRAPLPPEAQKAATSVAPHQTVYVPLAGAVDIEAEAARLSKEVARAEGELSTIEKKVSNPAFVAGAPTEIVARERERLAAAEEKLKKLRDALAKVKSLV